jgi:hypothetical protein
MREGYEPLIGCVYILRGEARIHWCAKESSRIVRVAMNGHVTCPNVPGAADLRVTYNRGHKQTNLEPAISDPKAEGDFVPAPSAILDIHCACSQISDML